MTAIQELTPTTHPAVWALLALGDDAPERLWVRGNADALTARQAVALTGCRASTAYGEHVGGELAADLAKTHTIVTGGAYGIDAQAAYATLNSSGTGVIVAAGGVNRVHPQGHRELAARIIETGGAIVSEVEPDEAPNRYRFARRQRLVAALSAGSVIVEAGWRSGSLSVATWARELGRPVGALPGPLTSVTSSGTHQLIRGGATLITSADDVRQMLV
ncbi:MULTISPECIES: DNA-processing protein DprA [unclassified Microbacterium]|jgi:DNA processing protein|uniref:DNA-processing protein DprA n=1 Tax=unclassified Microbacterium TaxID=2609290 RepID=UPI001DB80B3B|nr:MULTISPECIES: DNA-processing protein DprA [unclassified Microbacterium]MBT9608212.1 DNA-protecting protein DprA [Microbacterium sp.]CAH0142120.1 Putative DNA processing protein DprA [Microbacterium sp. Bi128]